MVGMAVVGERWFDGSELKHLLERARCGLETARELACLLGEVVTVEAVEPDIAIAVFGEKRFPCRPGRREGVGCKRLYHDHLRPKALPVAVKQNLLLGAFYVDFEEFEYGRRVSPAKLMQCRDRHGHGLRGFSELLVRRASMAFNHGREAVKILDQIKHGLADACAEERLDVAISRPDRSAQRRESGIGLDRDAVPALEIERERSVVVNRVPRSNIDIEAIAAAAE